MRSHWDLEKADQEVRIGRSRSISKGFSDVGRGEYGRDVFSEDDMLLCGSRECGAQAEGEVVGRYLSFLMLSHASSQFTAFPEMESNALQSAYEVIHLSVCVPLDVKRVDREHTAEQT